MIGFSGELFAFVKCESAMSPALAEAFVIIIRDKSNNNYNRW